MREAGFDPGAVTDRGSHLLKQKYKGYLELHIEQGPVLENRNIPVGIVTGIRGSARARDARCLGAYTHSGAVPHEYRSDARLPGVLAPEALRAVAESDDPLTELLQRLFNVTEVTP